MAASSSKPPLSWREARRRRAWALHRKGWKVTLIAEALGVTHGAVSQWLKAGREHGWHGVQPKSRRGQGARLSDEQLRSLPQFLEKGAEAYGFVGPLWTARRVALLIEREFGVRYHPNHVAKLLRGLRWSFHRVERVAAERNEGDIRHWLRFTWPEIKKKPTSRGEPLCSSTRAASASRRW